MLECGEYILQRFFSEPTSPKVSLLALQRLNSTETGKNQQDARKIMSL